MYLIGHALSNKEEYSWIKQLYASFGSSLFRTSEKYVCARIFLNSFMCLYFNCRTYRYVDSVLFVVSYVM